jgi:hypothetical protein
MKEFKIEDKILKVRLPNAVEALLLWGKIKKAIVEAEESSIHEAYSARCIEQLKNFVDLTDGFFQKKRLIKDCVGAWQKGLDLDIIKQNVAESDFELIVEIMDDITAYTILKRSNALGIQSEMHLSFEQVLTFCDLGAYLE